VPPPPPPFATIGPGPNTDGLPSLPIPLVVVGPPTPGVAPPAPIVTAYDVAVTGVVPGKYCPAPPPPP
jgi:hypothetical protein